MSVRQVRALPLQWRTPGLVYVGRRHRWIPTDVDGADGRWGNPFRVGSDRPAAEAVRLYTEHVERRLATEVGLSADVAALAGRTLVCWCTSGLCHADALAVLAERMTREV